MDRAINLENLTVALGTHTGLPDPPQLQRLLTDVEIGLFTQQAAMGEGMLDCGWYLQSVATARTEFQRRDVRGRRLAHQVSGHIFDLALQAKSLTDTERLRYTFAAQVGYIGGELTPNASALSRRAPLTAPPFAWTTPGDVSLEAGILLLALDRRALYPLLQARRGQLDQFYQLLGDAASSIYDAVDGVVRGIWDLTNFLTYGGTERLSAARQRFRAAMTTSSASSDLDSRWVAAHLMDLSDALGAASVWSVVPPNLSGASRAMTLGDPPVLLLWPPQLAFLDSQSDAHSPLSLATRRLVLSFPTSAGKSLLAQLLITTHLVAGGGDVCVVAPTHSLCRELAAALQPRLRTLGVQLHDDGPLGDVNARPANARVVVMTPEKLSARLRSNPEGLLDEYSLFVIDEAHLVGDGERGWRLEETISLLHHLTRDTNHRLVILSAALGNQVHIANWIDDGSGVLSKHEEWRGPRRLNVVYTPEPNWEEETFQEGDSRTRPRRRIPLMGVVRLKTSADAAGIVSRQSSQPVGDLVLKLPRKKPWEKDGDLSTRQRALLGPLIQHVASSGPVLVVEATKREAQKVAEEVASRFGEEYAAPFSLIETARVRLGENHPLPRILTKGVAFHHAALPIDIQSEIEDGVRRGDIRCLVATTTLTEGVNLPFKTVIVSSRGYPSAEGFVELVDAPKLLNAIGRAGRAGRETEGWLILVQHTTFNIEMFQDLERSGSDLNIRSTLVSQAAVEALARVEASAHLREDAILSNSEAIASGFISYVWFVADALEELRGTVTKEAVAAAIRDTLAWQQIDERSQSQLLRVSEIAFSSFQSQPVERRRRWSRTGASLPSAVVLERIAGEALEESAGHDGFLTVTETLDLLSRNGRLTALLQLGENKSKGFKPRRNAPRDQNLDIDMAGLLKDWVSGAELQELADRHVSGVGDPDYRYEQIAEFSASVFEHHLPWMFGILITWTNRSLESTGRDSQLHEDLPSAVHFGVNTRVALDLMIGGVRSRRLANKIAEEWREAPDDDNDDLTLREWLSRLGIPEWRARFGASPTELLDLLSFVRAPEARLVSDVLAGERYALPFVAQGTIAAGQEATIVPEADSPSPAPLAVMVAGQRVGSIAPEHHQDLLLLTDIGIPIAARVEMDATGAWQLDLRLAGEPTS